MSYAQHQLLGFPANEIEMWMHHHCEWGRRKLGRKSFRRCNMQHSTLN